MLLGLSIRFDPKCTMSSTHNSQRTNVCSILVLHVSDTILLTFRPNVILVNRPMICLVSLMILMVVSKSESIMGKKLKLIVYKTNKF